jgi:hypothetical protein
MDKTSLLIPCNFHYSPYMSDIHYFLFYFIKLSMDEVDDVGNEIECVNSLYRLVNQDIITINHKLTKSTFITVRKRKILGAGSHRNIGTEGRNE